MSSRDTELWRDDDDDDDGNIGEMTRGLLITILL